MFLCFRTAAVEYPSCLRLLLEDEEEDDANEDDDDGDGEIAALGAVGELLAGGGLRLVLLGELADEVLGEHILSRVRVANGLELDGAVDAGAVQESVGAAGVLIDKLGDVINLAPEDHPKVGLSLVLSNLLEGDDLESLAGHG